jgi:hypothetical protein
MSMQAPCCGVHRCCRIAYPTVNSLNFATLAPILIYFIIISLTSYLIFLTYVCSYLFQEVFEQFFIYTYTSFPYFVNYLLCVVFEVYSIILCIKLTRLTKRGFFYAYFLLFLCGCMYISPIC